jgi:hypothetical protein
MFLLQITNPVAQQVRYIDGANMVAPLWGLLDALASPGRQSDAALEIIGQKAIVAA